MHPVLHSIMLVDTTAIRVMRIRLVNLNQEREKSGPDFFIISSIPTFNPEPGFRIRRPGGYLIITMKTYIVMKMQASITGSPVHGVGYRAFLLDKALDSGLQRFDARNAMHDDKQRVIVRVEGEPAIIETFCSIIRSESPQDAIVSDVSFQEYSGYVIGINDFMHKIMVEQLTKGIPAIISIDKKQSLMLQKVDHMEISITGEITDLRTDQRSYLDRKLSVIEQDIQQIKTKIGLV
jgi:acylphosphatase